MTLSPKSGVGVSRKNSWRGSSASPPPEGVPRWVLGQVFGLFGSSYQTWSLVPAKRGSAHPLSTESASVREHTATAWLRNRPQPRAPPPEGLERVRILSRHFEMISGDFEVQELDASMDGLEEAAGKFELSPELNSDARDTWTGCRPSFPLSSASSHGALMVPEQAAPELGAAGSSDTPVMGAVVQGAARRRRKSCERCRIKKLKCPQNCPTLAVEPMALMPESAGGEPSVAQASSVPTRRLSSRGKAPRKAYPESLERRERATSSGACPFSCSSSGKRTKVAMRQMTRFSMVSSIQDDSLGSKHLQSDI